jgi:hypothetical protein
LVLLPWTALQQKFVSNLSSIWKNPLKQLAESGIEEEYLLITRSRGSTIFLWSHGSMPILVRKDAIQLGRMEGSGSAAEGMKKKLTHSTGSKIPRKN